MKRVIFGCLLAFGLSTIAVGCRETSTTAPESKDASGITVAPESTPAPAANEPAKSTPLIPLEPATTTLKAASDPVTGSGSLTSPRFTQTIPETLVEFEMVLVPGNEAQGIKPFYIGSKEVSWNEFGYWALCEDISLKKAIVEREKDLRPSPPHDVKGIFRGWGRENQPAVGISRLAAEKYCEWLNQQTGRKYRLPTSEEWDRAFVEGDGELDKALESSKLEKIAWFLGNSLDLEKTFDNRPMPLASLEPNSLGIYDMLGNVAEWVTGTGAERVARGGSFLTKAEDLTGAYRDVEDQDEWNKNYPRDPKSIWWYVDADFVGFRLVCEGE